MMKHKNLSIIAAAVPVTVLLWSASAAAQLPMEQVAPPPPVAPTPPPAASPAAAAPASAKPAQAAAKQEDPGSDHDLWIKHFGFGWYGVSEIPIALARPGGTSNGPEVIKDPDKFATDTVSAPAIGLRYWFNSRLGIDAAIGIGYQSGSQSSNNTSQSKQGKFGFFIHGGVPIAIANFRHFSFEIIPELNLAFASSSVSAESTANNAPPDASLKGFLLDLGGRVGGELFFGFIGIPQLALEGSVGAFLSVRNRGASVGNQTAGDSSFGVSTSSFNSPWDFFRSTVAARYYF